MQTGRALKAELTKLLDHYNEKYKVADEHSAQGPDVRR